MSSRGQVRTMDFRQREEYGDPRAALDFSVKKAKKDHEKENNGNLADAPMDLSKKPTSPPDVIMLSDSDDECLVKAANGFADLKNGDLNHVDKNKIIKRLQEELRNEEAKLVLLKKLRQSQRSHQVIESNDNNMSNNKAHQSRSNVPPPPLMRNAHSGMVSNSKHQIRGSPSQPSVRASPQHGPPPLMSSRDRMSSQASQNIRNSQQNNQSLLAAAGYRIPGQSNSHSQQSNQVSQAVIDNQTPGQRQAAAKLALRKQLEKTLLQIPPPKPPPPEMNFIPSLASNEFIMLVGLEEVVKTITDLDSNLRGIKPTDVKYVFNPFTCVQCNTDFTPVWKRDKPGSKNVICEDCVTNNQKKALKQEHTNRLKSAFVKALQQEQEIEQRLQAQPVTTVTTAAPQVSNPTVNIPGSYKPSQAQLTHQNLLQAHQATLQSAQHLAGLPAAAFANSRLSFPYPYGAKASDLQRQYLLDMIPSARSMHPQMQWKS
ncbi:transcriptional repressor p66-beta-like [Tubulanus polymorphus]|uniref:transcriptional repressor p66-beta-like n=1 Tax=Tubulanus polymorphus TaxID=672921 RepID=UPI003DA3E060